MLVLLPFHIVEDFIYFLSHKCGEPLFEDVLNNFKDRWIWSVAIILEYRFGTYKKSSASSMTSMCNESLDDNESLFSQIEETVE